MRSHGIGTGSCYYKTSFSRPLIPMSPSAKPYPSALAAVIATAAASTKSPLLSSPRPIATQSTTMGWHLLSKHHGRRQASGVTVAAHTSSHQSTHFDTAHSVSLRKYLNTHGLQPPQPETYDVQQKRCLAQLAMKTNNIEKYQYLATLRKNNVHLFYRLLVDHFTVCEYVVSCGHATLTVDHD